MKNSSGIPKKNFFVEIKKLDKFFSIYVTLMQATKLYLISITRNKNYGNSKKSTSKKETGS